MASSSTPRPGQAASARRIAAWPHAFVWLLVPVLALIAYAPVAGLWFVADDFGHLRYHETIPWPQPFLMFPGGVMFYRPLSTTLTWDIGYALFGTNALPYHLVSLLLHALAAWLLARAMLALSGDRLAAWIAGALFAVYPLCTEPVAWLAAQWDLWAAVGVLAAVWAFARAWELGSPRIYAGGILAAATAVMMKESALPLPLVLPFAALVVEARRRKQVGTAGSPSPAADPRFWRRPLLWSAPYALPSLLFVALRVFSGGIGGYPNAAGDLYNFAWDALAGSALQLLMPLNRALFDPAVVQLVGLLIGGAFLAGLALWGARCRPLLLLALAWFLAFVAPVLNLRPGHPETLGSRLLYLAVVAFCIASAALLSAWLEGFRSLRAVALIAIALPLLVLPLTWTQQRAWVRSSAQTRHIVDEMRGLVVPYPARQVVFNVKDLPADYKGSYVFVNGFDSAMHIFAGQPARLQTAEQLDAAQLVRFPTGTGGVYNVAFALDPAAELFRVAEIAGITAAMLPPAGALRTWDFTTCDARTAAWSPQAATLECAAGDSGTALWPGYTVYRPAQPDSHLSMPATRLDLSGARWLRLAFAARQGEPGEGRRGQWLWDGAAGAAPNEQRGQYFPLDPGTSWRTYWTYVPVSQLGEGITGLGLDPIDAGSPLHIAWISVDILR